jgi:hypothetical protein
MADPTPSTPAELGGATDQVDSHDSSVGANLSPSGGPARLPLALAAVAARQALAATTAAALRGEGAPRAIPPTDSGVLESLPALSPGSAIPEIASRAEFDPAGAGDVA